MDDTYHANRCILAGDSQPGHFGWIGLWDNPADEIAWLPWIVIFYLTHTDSHAGNSHKPLTHAYIHVPANCLRYWATANYIYT